MKKIINYNSVVDYLWQEDQQRNQNLIATEYEGNNITRAEYWSRVEYYKNFFISQGFFEGCGKPVTICKKNVPEYEFMYLALLELGAIVSTVSYSFFKSDVKRHSIDKGADTIILSAEYINSDLKEALKDLGDNKGPNSIKRIIFTSAGDYASEEKTAKYNSQFDFKSMIKSLNLPSNIEIFYPGHIKKLSDSKIILPQRGSLNLLDYAATYSNTGGTTTGIPSCAVHTHRAITSLFEAHEPHVFLSFPVKEGDRVLLLIPISHITSQFYALLLRRASGATIVYSPNAFEPTEIAKALITNEINDVIAPFSLYVLLANSPLKKGDLKNLYPSCGGEATPYRPTVLVNERLTWAGAKRIVIGGGSTETGSAIMNTYGIEDRTNETGSLIPGAEAKIINPLNGKEVAKGERGILYSRCPWQMKELLNNPVGTAKVLKDLDDNGKPYVTNNDICSEVREYDGKPVYSMDGRVTAFVKDIIVEEKKYYTPGISFTDGNIDPVDFSQGRFLFDIRDKFLNIPNVLEAEVLIMPQDDNHKYGSLVSYLVTTPNADLVDIIKNVKAEIDENDYIPKDTAFLTNFARSTATDKREVVTLTNHQGPFYSMDDQDIIYSATMVKGQDSIYSAIEDLNTIQRSFPPEPAKILVRK